MAVIDALDEVAVIVEYINTIVPYMIGCDSYDYSVSTNYCIKFNKRKDLPSPVEIKSLIKLLESVKGLYENEMLISEFVIILEKLRRKLNEDAI